MFGLDAWVLWLIIGVIFIISEIFTAGFVMAPLGLAALSSSLLAFLFPNVSFALQLLTFVIASTVLIFTGQKIANKIAKDPSVRVGADRLIDAAGIVLEEINQAKNTGRVRIGQDEWRAISIDETVIPRNSKVTVKKVDGTRLKVQKTQKTDN